MNGFLQLLTGLSFAWIWLTEYLTGFPWALNQGMERLRRMTFQRNTSDIKESPERRKKLLAMIHIAQDELCWSDIQYRLMLSEGFGVPTASALTNEQLEKIVAYFIREGWKPRGRQKTKQSCMLQKKAIEFIPQIPGGKDRVEGLCRKLCGVEKVQWCNDPLKLKRLLAAMGNIKRKEAGAPVFLRGVG